MSDDSPGRAPNPSWWAVRRGDRWHLVLGAHDESTYRESISARPITADAALAWLTDHRRRNPR